MRIGIMQPYFFPYIGYWQLINAVDRFVIYDDVNFINRGWINRNRILINGEPGFIRLHLSTSSQNKLINETLVINDLSQNKKLLRTVSENYRRAPFFNNAFSIIEDIIMQEELNLAKYLEFSIRQICEYLQITTELIVSSDIIKDDSMKGQEKIISICNLLKADVYINAIGGKELYTPESFRKKRVNLRFLKTGETKYSQYNDVFVPCLSIIDVIMHNSVDEVRKMLLDYSLC